MKRTILIFCLVGSAAGHAAVAQRATPAERGPALVYSRDKRPVPDKRLSSRTERLSHPSDKSKAVDFKIENVDAANLDVIYLKWDAETKKLFISVKNTGTLASKPAYLHVRVFRRKLAPKVSGKQVSITSQIELVASAGREIIALKGGQLLPLGFDFTDDLFKPYQAAGYGESFVECTLVTEPIAVK